MNHELLVDRLRTEADLCANEHADDIAALLNEAADALAAHPSAAPQGAQPAEPAAKGPDSLWLQLHGDCHDSDLDEPVDYTSDDVTWCWHQIHDSDVRYVRADLAAASPADAAPVVPQEVRRDAARMDWLEQAYTDGALHKYRWAAFMTYRAAIDAAMNAGLTIPAKEQQ